MKGFLISLGVGLILFAFALVIYTELTSAIPIKIVVGVPECSRADALLVSGGLPFCDPSKANFECEAGASCNFLLSTDLETTNGLPQGERLTWNLGGEPGMEVLSQNVSLGGLSASFEVIFAEPGEYKPRVTVTVPGKIFFADLESFVVTVH